MSIRVRDIEITAPFQSLRLAGEEKTVRLLARYHGKPIGWFEVKREHDPVISAASIRASFKTQLGWQLMKLSLDDKLWPLVTKEVVERPISVVVCTRDRTENLKRCLDALLALDYTAHEIIVIDNAPSTDETREAVSALPVRYVREPRAGLDFARNRGIAEARYSIVAFTDDDTRADKSWLKAISAAFEEPDVEAVTGMIAPMSLRTQAENYFEFIYGGMDKGPNKGCYVGPTMSSRNMLWASAFGAGANMAFRKELIDRIGNFDPALDVGTPARGGGDIEFFHRVVASGSTLMYEPGALVWHQHRKTMEKLKAQISDNGCAFGCYLRTCWNNRTVPRSRILKFFTKEWMWEWIIRRFLSPGKHSRRLILAELRGMLQSGNAYRASQVYVRQTVAQSRSKETSASATDTIPRTLRREQKDTALQPDSELSE